MIPMFPNVKFLAQSLTSTHTKTETKRIHEIANARWEYAVCLSPVDEFTQVSFVNGIWTLKGGKHVDNVVNQIIKNMSEMIVKKNKDISTIKPSHIRDNLFVFIIATIVNQAFDSQTKDFLTTPIAKFGSKFNLSKQFYNKLYATKLTKNVITPVIKF